MNRPIGVYGCLVCSCLYYFQSAQRVMPRMTPADLAKGGEREGQGLVPVGGAGAAKRATATKAWPCREREAEPLSSSKQGKVAPLAVLNAWRRRRPYSGRRIAARRADLLVYGIALGKPDCDDLTAPVVPDRDGGFMLIVARRHRAKARII